MKILLDTSIIIDVDRQQHETVALLKKIIMKHELVISTITVAETLTGAYLQDNPRKAVVQAKSVLNQCSWVDVDAQTAEFAAKLYAFTIRKKKIDQIEYPDVLIAAAFLRMQCDKLLTWNVKDFKFFPELKDKVFTPKTFA